MQTIGLIDGTARLREFVAAVREKGIDGGSRSGGRA
jgi:hypothetical protein